MGKARILKRSLYARVIYTNKPRYDRDLKNTCGGKSQAFLYNILKELGDKITKEQRKFSILTLILVLI
jgi:hypothetical protein